MQIYARVSGLPGLTCIEACADHTVRQLKSLIIRKCSLTTQPSRLRLYTNRDWADHLTVQDLHLQHGCTVHVAGRLCGGGGDGGSTGAESRSCYLEMYLERKPDKVNPAEELSAKWTRCQLSGQALSPPCVCDWLGNLYNKDALVQGLLSKSLPKHLNYIRGLKNLVNLKLHESGQSGKSKVSIQSTFQASNEAEFSCPLTGLEMNGRFQFYVHPPTGHVFSKRAWKEAPAAVEELLGQTCSEGDLILLYPTGEDLERATACLTEVSAVSKKKSKSKAGADKAQEPVTTNDKKRSSDGAPQEKSDKKLKVLEHMPAHATKEVYASLFKPANTAEKETFLCRNTSARGFAMS